MNIISVFVFWFFLFPVAAGLLAGIIALVVVRKKERRRRMEFQQAVQRRSQEAELKKMKLDDL